MPKYVDVEDVGLIEFPDEFSDEQIKSSLDTDFIPRLKKGALRDTAARLGRDIGTSAGQTISGYARGAQLLGDAKVPSILRSLGAQAAMSSEAPPEEAAQPFTNLASKSKQESKHTAETRLSESPTYQFGKQTQEQAQEFFRPNPTMDQSMRAGIVQGVASTVPVLAGGALGPLGPVAGMANYAAMSGEQGAQEAISAGHPEMADDAYLAYAGLGAITEAAVGVPYQILKMVRTARASGVPAKQFGDTFKKGLAETIRKVGGETIKGGAREFVQEGSEQAGQNLAASDLVGFQPDRELTKGVWENALYGGIVGMMLGLPMGVGQRQIEGSQALQSAKEARAAKNWLRGQAEDQAWNRAIEQSAADNANRATMPGRVIPGEVSQPAQPITQAELEQSVRDKLAEIRANPNPTDRDLSIFEFLVTKGRTLEQIAQKLNFTIQEPAPESTESTESAAVPGVPVSPAPLVAARDDTPAPGTPPSILETRDEHAARIQRESTAENKPKAVEAIAKLPEPPVVASTPPVAAPPELPPAKPAVALEAAPAVETPRTLIFKPGDPASFLWAGQRRNGTYLGTNPQGLAVMRITQGGSTLTSSLQDLREPITETPTTSKPAAPAPEVKAELRAAFKNKDGTVYIGDYGQMHSTADDQIRLNNPDAPRILGEAGFATPDGKFLTRDEAFDWTKQHKQIARQTEGHEGKLDYKNYVEANRIEQKGVTKEPTKAQKSVSEVKADAPKAETATNPSQEIAYFVKTKLSSGQSLTAQELFSKADVAYGGTQAEGKYSPKNAYDAMELGVNQLIRDAKVGAFAFWDPTTGSVQDAVQTVRSLKAVIELLPTQTKRTAEQDEFQQFSTPPPLAYVAAWTANLKPSDVVLEPSAGIGGIAVFGKVAGATVIGNELSPRRRAVLQNLGLDQVFGENAEQIHNILPATIKPTVVLMNPPFSATAGRLQGKRKTSFSTAHIEQALARLEPGGRLIAIVGEGMALDRPTFKSWWDKISKNNTIRANIGISGDEYKKYGTTFGNQIIVIDKVRPPSGWSWSQIVSGKVTKIEELLPLLEGIRNERTTSTSTQAINPAQQPATPAAEPIRVEPGAAKPAISPPAAPTEGTGVNRPPSRPSTGGMGAQSSEGAQPKPSQEPIGPRPIPGSSPELAAQPPVEPAPTIGPGQQPASPEQRPVEPAQQPGGGVGATPEGVGAQRPGDTSELGLEDSEQVQNKLDEKQVYEDYLPQVAPPGSKPHPTPLSESAAMRSVKYPNVAYRPRLDSKVITEGRISDAQFESVMLAGAAHTQTLPNGSRRGFFVGDGTGVGKGRTIAAIVWDNWNNGRKKAVWISRNKKLIKDATRDIEDIGYPGDLVKISGKASEPIKAKDGVLFTTYGTLKSEEKKADTAGKKASRLEQIVNWVGKDFDGVLVFDEAHAMANAIDTTGGRGLKKPSATALKGLELQRALPNARIVYVSATGATEVSNLAYADRLGLWGEDTPFPTVQDFTNQIGSGGVAAMEVVAKDLKSLGLYMSRTLNFDGVTYRKVEQELTEKQRDLYDQLAKSWQMVLRNIEAALGLTGGNQNSMAKRNAKGQFWGAHQRFFNALLTSLQLPSMIKSIKADLANGDAVVIQLVNTNEAAQERAAAGAIENDEDLEDLEVSGKDILLQFVEKAFPTQQYEETTDEDGNTVSRMVVDSAGNPVQNPEALAMKEALLNRLASLNVPAGILDSLIEEFGIKSVAEVTGRSRRLVRNEEGRKEWEKRGEQAASADVSAFNDDRKPILIFSDAGGTGASYHADKRFKNQRIRRHYIAQPGWRADNAVQGLGRSHRSNQAQPPEFITVSTDLPGHKRFVSSIARRIEQLGAITKGQRQASSQGVFDARDNLESSYAKEALRIFMRDLASNRIEGVSPAQFSAETGLDVLDGNGQFIGDQIQIKSFLNRLLSLTVATQNLVFDAFSKRLDNVIEYHRSNGTLDVGMETLNALKTTKASEQVLHTDATTGTQTKLVELKLEQPSRIQQWSDKWKGDGSKFVVNLTSERIWKVSELKERMDADGTLHGYYVTSSPNFTFQSVPRSEMNKERFRIVEAPEAQQLWNTEASKIPKTYTQTVHLVTGTILPVWDRLGDIARIARAQTDDGERMIGVLTPESQVATITRNFGLKLDRAITANDAVDAIVNRGAVATLANGWKIMRRRVSGENRIEISGPDYSDQAELERKGVISERIQWNMRYFVPTGSTATQVLESILRSKPIVDLTEGTERQSRGKAVGEPISEQAATQAVNERLGTTELPSNIRFVANLGDLKGRVVYTAGQLPQIEISLAHHDTPDSVADTLVHELLHPSQDDPAMASAVRSVAELVQETDRARKSNLKYDASKTGIEATNELIRQFYQEHANSNIFFRAVTQVVIAVKRIFGIELTATQAAVFLVQDAVKNHVAAKGGQGLSISPRQPGEPIYTQVFGNNETTVPDRIQITPEMVARVSAANRRFMIEAGFEPEMLEEVGGRWKLRPEFEVNHEIHGPGTFDNEIPARNLIEIIKRELARGREGAIDITFLNDAARAMLSGDNVTSISRGTRDELFSYSQGDTSMRGVLLGLHSIDSKSITYIGRNVGQALRYIYGTQYGGPEIRGIMREIVTAFRAYLTDEQIAGGLEGADAAKLVDHLIQLSRQDEGSRLFRSLQATLKPKIAKTTRQKQAKAEFEEEFASVLEKFIAAEGKIPKALEGQKLSPLKALVHILDPKTSVRIQQAIDAAVAEAELKAARTVVELQLKTAERAQDEQSVAELSQILEDLSQPDAVPDPLLVEQGFKLPQFKHWAIIRETDLSYSPTTLKLMRDVVKQDFRGTKFPSLLPKVERPADTRIDLRTLAKQPDAEVARVVQASLDNIAANMGKTKASPELQAKLLAEVQNQISEQLSQRRTEFLDSLAEVSGDFSKTPLTDEQKAERHLTAVARVQEVVNAMASGAGDTAALSRAQRIHSLTPTLAKIARQILDTPVAKQDEFAVQFANQVMRELHFDPAMRDKLEEIFSTAFDQKMREARKAALETALNNLSPAQKMVARKNPKGAWNKIKEIVNAGGFEAGPVLDAMAEANNWKKLTPEIAKQMRDWVDELQALQVMSPAWAAQVSPTTSEEQLQMLWDRAHLQEGIDLKRKIETMWARLTVPLNYKTGMPNVADAAYELSSAALLLKFGFPPRQVIDVFFQGLIHGPTRSIQLAWDNVARNVFEGRPGEAWKETSTALLDGAKLQVKAYRLAISSAQASLRGAPRARNVDDLGSRVMLFERAIMRAEEEAAKGNHVNSVILSLFSQVRWGRNIAAALDSISSIPALFQEMRQQAIAELRDYGKSREEANRAVDTLMGDITADWHTAITTAKRIAELDGKERTKSEIERSAVDIVQGIIYQRMKNASLPVDDFEARNAIYQDVWGWNKTEEGGPGGLIAAPMRKVSQLGRDFWPAAFFGVLLGRFSNAVANSVNLAASFTPLGYFPQLFGVIETGPRKNLDERGDAISGSNWYRTAEDRVQRKVQATLGTAIGSVAMGLVALGLAVVRWKPPDDPKERELWFKLHRPGTVEFMLPDGSFIPISLSVGPLRPLAPYFVAAGAWRERADKVARQQAILDAEAARTGQPAGKVAGLSTMDYLAIAGQAAWSTMIGGRTATGMAGSLTDYGIPNVTKAAASGISSLLPPLPAYQEMMRMAGVRMDTKAASFFDYLVPIPGSAGSSVNMMGDRIDTEGAMRRVVQIASGGSYPLPVSDKDLKGAVAYATLLETGQRPPSINPNKGYSIGGEFRPMSREELSKFAVLRGTAIKSGLESLGPIDGLDRTAATEAVRNIFSSATQNALRAIGADVGGGTMARRQQTRSLGRFTPGRRLRRSSSARRFSVGRSSRFRMPRLTGGMRFSAKPKRKSVMMIR